MILSAYCLLRVSASFPVFTSSLISCSFILQKEHACNLSNTSKLFHILKQISNLSVNQLLSLSTSDNIQVENLVSSAFDIPDVDGEVPHFLVVLRHLDLGLLDFPLGVDALSEAIFYCIVHRVTSWRGQASPKHCQQRGTTISLITL